MEDKKCPECEYLNGSDAEEFQVLNKDLMIYENASFAAYYSIRPVVENHVEIIPKNHHFRVMEFSPEEWSDFGEILKTVTVAGSFRTFHLFTPSGFEYGKHLAIHILPGGEEGFEHKWEPKMDIDSSRLKALSLSTNEVKKNIPIENRSIILDPDIPRSEDIKFEEIMPGMPCLLHGKRHNCEYAPPKDAIPPIYEPKFVSPDVVDYLKDEDLVSSVTINGETRAYPISFLDFHEIVNDNIGDTHFAVSYCPLCASSLVFNRQIQSDAPPTGFGVSGFLYQSDLMMYDHATESLWSQIEGKCVYGKHNGQELDLIPFELVAWDKWKKANPDGKVLSIDTGFDRDYTHYPYGEYMTMDRTIFPVNKKDEEERLHPKTIIYGIESAGIAKVYPEDFLLDQKLVEDMIGKTPLAIVIDDADGVIALERVVDGKTLTFKRTDSGLVDNETNTTWTFQGKAIEGTNAGKMLTRRPDVLRMFYFAWVAFNPNVEVEIYNNIHEKPSWRERLFAKFKKDE